MNTILADAVARVGSGSDLVHNVFFVLIIAVCLAIVWWFGDWIFKKMGVPAVVLTIWMIFFAFIAVVIALNFLLSLTGHPFIQW